MNDSMRQSMAILVLSIAFLCSMWLNRADLVVWFELNFGSNATENSTFSRYNGTAGQRRDASAVDPTSISPSSPESEAACKLSGNVIGCGCDYASVEYVIHHELQPVLRELVQTPFFRHYKVNLFCDCEFWPDEGMCFQKDCCVKECEESEVPEPWRLADTQSKRMAEQMAAEESCEGGGSSGSGVDREVGEGVTELLESIQGWHGLDNPWVPDSDANLKYTYVNLQSNPEKYTGYKGEDARRIWAAIYAQSVFEGPTRQLQGQAQGQAGDGEEVEEVCEEQIILYRLVSGMHSSITASIINNYYNEETGEWGPNMPFFKARFGSPASKQYIENMYFAFLFVLRAVMKIGPTLNYFDYNTGFPEEDAATYKLIDRLEANDVLLKVCPAPFDEALLSIRRGDKPGDVELEKKLQVAFHNITRLIDCVGCEKCRMWAKLQIQGIATALKIVFHLPEEDVAGVATSSAKSQQNSLKLERNEVIALINLLAKLADSVEVVRSLSLVMDQEAGAA